MTSVTPNGPRAATRQGERHRRRWLQLAAEERLRVARRAALADAIELLIESSGLDRLEVERACLAALARVRR